MSSEPLQPLEDANQSAIHVTANVARELVAGMRVHHSSDFPRFQFAAGGEEACDGQPVPARDLAVLLRVGIRRDRNESQMFLVVLSVLTGGHVHWKGSTATCFAGNLAAESR
jgi:hypothetical protein